CLSPRYLIHRDLHSFPTRRSSDLREIIRWDKKTKQALTVYTLPPNDNLNKGARFAVDERSIYGNSIYFFHVMDKRSGEVTYQQRDRKSTRLNSSHVKNSYAVFCLK